MSTTGPQAVDAATMARYLSGECSPSEMENIEHRISSDPEVAAQLADLEVAWAKAAEPELKWDMDAQWSGLRNQMGITRTAAVRREIAKVNNHKPKTSRTWMTSIGVALGILAVALAIPRINNSQSQAKTYTTGTAQRANVSLTDGSRIILGPSTTMSVNGRSVVLSGEASFTVRNHSNEPFTVTTGHTVTRVLGTTFGIRAYGGDIRVAVRDGRVSVAGATLGAGDVVHVKGSGKAVITRNADVSPMLSWTSGSLEFKSAPINEVLEEASRWSGLNFILTSSGEESRTFTGTIAITSPQDMVNTLALAMNMRPVQKGSVVTLYPKEVYNR